jgi:predicted Rdx family selenoprotein
LPSIGGPFEITVDGRLLFSKRSLGRFPADGEAEQLVAGAVAAAPGTGGPVVRAH